MARRRTRFLPVVAVAWAAVAFLGIGYRVLADCSSYGLPFTDLDGTAFCAQIAEAYFAGLTNGTGPTTYAPSQDVPREQMAAFVTRTLDQSLLRGNRRAALDQWWTQTPHYDKASLGLTRVGSGPALLKSDGGDVWVANQSDGTVSRVSTSDGKNLGTWTGATDAVGVLVAMGRVFVTGFTGPGHLYMIDPTGSPGAVTTVASALPNGPAGVAFDGKRIWTTNNAGSISIINPGSSTPWSATTVTTGFTQPRGIIFDGTNIWITDVSAGKLFKLDSGGAILQTVDVSGQPNFPAFDGHNIWVPNDSPSSLDVIRASDGAVLKTFSAANANQNGLNFPQQAAFDGQRILVTNEFGGLSLFKATDLSIIGNPATPGVSLPHGVCSDGIDFWVSLSGSDKIGRF